MRLAKPKVSVLLPIYNAEKYLFESIESIRTQNYSDFEVLLLDDGSTDSSVQIAQSAAARDGRFISVAGEKKGLIFWLNEGIRQARGEFIARMDADDISLPDRLKKQVDFFDSHYDCCAVGCQAIRVDPDNLEINVWVVPTVHEEIDSWHINGNGGGIIHPTAMIRRDALVRIGGYSTSYEAAEDFDLFLRLAEIGRLANLPDVLLRYRLHAKSVTMSRVAIQIQSMQNVVCDTWIRRGITSGNPPVLAMRGTPSESELLQSWALNALTAGHFRTARKHSLRLLSRQPLSPKRWFLATAALFGPVSLLLKRFLPFRIRLG